jgi:hypothetical protein
VESGLGVVVGRSHRFTEGEFDPAHVWSHEGHQLDTDVLSGCALGEPLDKTLVEGADDGSGGVVRIDVEGAVVEIDADGVVAPDGGLRVEREAVERFHDFPHGLLDGRVAERAGQLPASAGAFLFRGADRSLAIGVGEERKQAPDKEADLRVAGEEGLAEPIALGRPTPTGWRPGFFFENAGFEQPFEMGSYRRGVDPQDAGQFGDLTGPLFECFDDFQASGVAQEAMALGSDLGRGAPFHRSAQHDIERRGNEQRPEVAE